MKRKSNIDTCIEWKLCNILVYYKKQLLTYVYLGQTETEWTPGVWVKEGEYEAVVGEACVCGGGGGGGGNRGYLG
jgi:hypothetical protein